MSELAAAGGVEGLVDRASFIFVGKILARGRSSVRDLSPRPELAIAELELPLRVDPVLGDPTGQPITVLPAPGADIAVGRRLIFFANSWVHAEAIAVVALANLAAKGKLEQQVKDAVNDLPRRRLAERVARAKLIAHAVVGGVQPASEVREPLSEHSPRWRMARLRVQDVLKGELPRQRGQTRTVSVYFPGSDDVAYWDVPKLREGEEAVYLLHEPPEQLPRDAFVLPDSLDVQPVQRKAAIGRVVADQQPPAEG